ncbi:MAG: restriction endonuclease [Planctomycetes bacterium]|nr:restriction endonuclease [Planctomycetota bacterium]
MNDEDVIPIGKIVRLPLGAILALATQFAIRAKTVFDEEWPQCPEGLRINLDWSIGVVGVEDHFTSGVNCDRAYKNVEAAYHAALAAHRRRAAESLHVISAATKAADAAYTAIGSYSGEGHPDNEERDNPWHQLKYDAAFNTAGAAYFCGELGLRDEIVGDYELLQEIHTRESWGEANKPSAWVLFGADSTTDALIERRVLFAINDMCVSLCELIAKNRTSLAHVEWRDLERVVALALGGLGFDISLMPGTKDGGKDVVAQVNLCGRRRTYYIEIKHWRSGKLLGPSTIDTFVEVNAHDRTDGGLFLSTSGFAPAVYSQLAEISQTRIRLGTDIKVITLCQHFVRNRKSSVWQAKEVLPSVLFEHTVTYLGKR